MRKNRLLSLLLALFAALLTVICPPAALHAETTETDLGLTARSALLMEASTGTVLYEQNADEELSPASITKIMTLLLIFDALEEGRISLTDLVTTSAYAKSMGGSQVFLEEGEQQTVETMIKCIVIASGNDASVAMAEHLAGSETEFVRQMNERAEELGMSGTHFEDCCGLTESETHRTTARDVAIMSRELITRYPQISDYATIWMENITHVTANGSSEFTLSNTNKLLKMTQSFRVTGLKTGSTSLAKYCFSGTAEQDGIHLIAVVMAAPDYKTRFSEAQSMLNYGFSICSLYEDTDSDREELPALPVERGKSDSVSLSYADSFSYLSTTGEDFSQIERRITLPSSLTAPIEEGAAVGSLEYILDGRTLGRIDIVTTAAVERAGYPDFLRRFWEAFLGTGLSA
ncbi:MAG: D-alanyl-D-alanine carboxypeptidase [Lachnospiraceae bacterium]|nr:D-alanyl-D-alanine carboxypeptidase [Lachnospiraceae bacterium]